MKTILIATKGYARYRSDLIVACAGNLPEGWKLVHTTPQTGKSLWEVDWKRLLVEKGPVTHINFPRITLREIFNGFKKASEVSGEDRIEQSLQEPSLIVIQEFSLPMLKLLIYGKLRNIPVIVCSDLGKHSNWGQFPKHTIWLHRLAHFFTSGYIAHTRSAETAISASARPHIFIPHSIDITGISQGKYPSDGNTINILSVGQYIPRKGYDLLVKAAVKIKESGISNFQVNLVGTQNSTWLTQVINEAKMEQHFNVLGVLKGEELFAQFQKADFFVLASRFDTFAVVVHEAAAFGLPLVISKFAESSQLLVAEGKNGFVIDPFDIEAFATTLTRLIKDTSLRNSMSLESKEISASLCASIQGKRMAKWLTKLG